MTPPRHIVIAGAGLAAQRATQALRRRGHDGPIAIVGDEATVPYDRPPLSKEYLSGAMEASALELRPSSWYADHGVELILDDPATSLDLAERRVNLASGARLGYDRLLVATGARPRELPGTATFANVHVLRSAADAQRLRAVLRPGTRLAIAGAGFIGQEAAATARSLGAEVTMIEAAPTPLFGQLGPRMGAWFAELHREEGARVLLGAQIASLRGDGDELTACVLADGTVVETDVLLVGIGVRAAGDWLAGSGLPTDGIPVDAAGRSGAPGVFAAGDVSRPIDPATGEPGRSDHWEAAVAQAAAAAHGMLGLDPPRGPRPSFWSDQYGTRIQFAGDARGADGVEIDGDPAARDFSALFHRGGVVRAGLLVGRPRALPKLREQLGQPIPDRRTA
ncbi:MAG TPA: FAD-dependent oxidoreductase [Thermoleophilaceae bacterium]|jgi:3-phenylpropionate/trans-cinnamate dioxygenase ferredoxin reductase subunit